MRKKPFFLLLLVLLPAILFVGRGPASKFYLAAKKQIVRLNCRGPKRFFTTLGMLSNPYCATNYPDGGKTCTSGSDCQSGICYLYPEKIKELENNNLPLTGACKADDIPACFSLSGAISLENGKAAGSLPIYG